MTRNRRSVRVVHDTIRGGVFTVTDLGRPYKGVQSPCVTCGTVHLAKTYHLVLDADGATVVSAGVWAGLKRAGEVALAGLRPESEVAKPPNQTLIMARR